MILSARPQTNVCLKPARLLKAEVEKKDADEGEDDDGDDDDGGDGDGDDDGDDDDDDDGDGGDDDAGDKEVGGGGAQQWATVVIVVLTMPVEIVALPLALGSHGVELFTSISLSISRSISL